MSYMTKDQLENYLNGLPSGNKEKKSEYSQIKSELVYPMQQMSVQPQEEQEEEVSYGTIQERMKRLRNATGTVLNATNTMTPAFPETPKPMVPTKPSFSSSEPDAFESSLNPRLYAQRRQQRQQQQQQQQPYASPEPPVQKKPTTPPLPPFISSPSTPPPAVPSSPRPPKPNNRESMVRTLNPIYAGLECPACHKSVDGSVVSAMDNIWHTSCFKCTACQKILENEQYFEKDGQPYCGKDYKNLFSLHCDFCHEPIEDSAISALGKHYHEGHFGCTACKTPFGDDSAFMVHEGNPYCQDDYMKICGKKCSGCSEYISGEYINALGQEWHKSCFNCFDCKKPFTNGTFLVKDNKPYCEEHYHHPRQQQTPKQLQFEQKPQQPQNSRQQQPPKQPQFEQKPQQPRQEQERKPPAIKPKPTITRKPDFLSKPEPEINRPEISNYSSNILKTEKKVVPATSGSKICHQCNSAIDGPSASALGHDYHIHHFQCSHCNRSLSSRVPGMWKGDAQGELICKMCAFKNNQQ